MIKIAELAEIDPSVKTSLNELRKIGIERMLGQAVQHGEYVSASKYTLKLLDLIPKSRKYKAVKRMVKVFIRYKGKVQNFKLAQCIEPTVQSNRMTKRKLSKTDYLSKNRKYNNKIKNRFRTINKLFGSDVGITKFDSEFSRLLLKKRATPAPHF